MTKIEQATLDDDDIHLRVARLEELYDEETYLRAKIEKAKKTIKESKSAITQNTWQIREQLRLIMGREPEQGGGDLS